LKNIIKQLVKLMDKWRQWTANMGLQQPENEQ
jgi:hypothetical protein